MSFLEELVKKGIITQNQILEIKNRAREKYNGDIDDTLVDFGVNEDTILNIKGGYLQIPVRKINRDETSFDALKYISEDSARHYGFIPIDLKDGALEVGVVNPENMEAMDALQFISTKIGIPFKLFLISKSDYKSVLDS